MRREQLRALFWIGILVTCGAIALVFYLASIRRAKALAPHVGEYWLVPLPTNLAVVTNKDIYKDYITYWSSLPWYGQFDKKCGWVPRRTFYECLVLLTGKDFPNSPDAWEEWMLNHPEEVRWDPCHEHQK